MSRGNSPWPIWIPSEPQQSATSVHVNATRPQLHSRSSSFLAAISLHLRALSPALAAAPPRRVVAGNPHSVSLAASSSPALGAAGARKRTTADSARRLTSAISTCGSAARMDRTRAAVAAHHAAHVDQRGGGTGGPLPDSRVEHGRRVSRGAGPVRGCAVGGRWRGAVGWRRLGFGLA
jgi:hypothetical protein